MFKKIIIAAVIALQATTAIAQTDQEKTDLAVKIAAHWAYSIECQIDIDEVRIGVLRKQLGIVDGDKEFNDSVKSYVTIEMLRFDKSIPYPPGNFVIKACRKGRLQGEFPR